MQDVVVLGDGSSLVITGLEPSAASTHSPPEEGTLSTVQEVQSFVSEAIAAGITFDLLKTLVLSLARGGHLKVRPTATADDVRNTLQRYFLNAGYDDINIKEIRQVDGQGWIGKGSVDTQPFHAVSDESAHIVHVRIE